MAKRISYDDNIFLLSEKVRILSDCLDLDIDEDIFLDNVVDEIMFIEESFKTIYASLTENSLLLERPDHLHSLMRAKGRFALLLDSISDGTLSFASHMEPFSTRFKASAAVQRDDVDDIRALLTEGDDGASADKTLVSEEEFKYLLMEEESSDGEI